MKISELKNAPQWLKDANVENEDVEIINGVVVWNDGTWKSGIWENGVWKYGVWNNGIWKNGTWKSGVWNDGTWNNGIWNNGIWENGVWKYGIWENGIWKNGAWKSGAWKSGTWENGTWSGGFSLLKSKYIPLINKNIIRLGCKQKTVEEWNEWFSGTEEFETKRGTKEFQMIYAHFKACEAYINAMNQNK